MFVRGFRGVRGMGDYVARQPSDWKLDNWIGQPVGGGLQTVPAAASSVIPGVNNATATAIGVGGLAAAAALAWYLFKK